MRASPLKVLQANDPLIMCGNAHKQTWGGAAPQIPAPTMYLYYVSIKNISFTNFRPVPSDGTFLATGGGESVTM